MKFTSFHEEMRFSPVIADSDWLLWQILRHIGFYRLRGAHSHDTWSRSLTDVMPATAPTMDRCIYHHKAATRRA
eukprot:747586-Hanusia_phi.AAC.1